MRTMVPGMRSSSRKRRGLASRLTSLAAIVQLLVILAACSPGPTGRAFQTELTHPDDPPIPFVLIDQTGLVTSVESVSVPLGDSIYPVVSTDATSSDAFIVSWLGGLCEKGATATFRSSGEGHYAFALRVDQTTGSCPAIAIPRGLRVMTQAPVPVNSITATR